MILFNYYMNNFIKLLVIQFIFVVSFPSYLMAEDFIKAKDGKDYASGRIIVKFWPKFSDGEIVSTLKKFNANPNKNFYDKRSKSSDALSEKKKIWLVDVFPGSEKTTIADLSKDKRVQFAELDKLIPASAVTVNDPLFSSEWHLPVMGVPDAWSTSTGAGVTVAVLDSGVEASHPDLVANLLTGWNIISKNTNTSPVDGHGTNVSGVIAAVANNGIGVAGIAYNTKIFPVRVTNSAGTAWAWDIIEGIYYVADNGAYITNLSFDTSGNTGVEDAGQYLFDKGGMLYSGAGNSGTQKIFENSPFVVYVSATDQADNLASFSSYGPYVDVSAPGVGIMTTGLSASYPAVQGTSFSTPVVASVAALVKSAYPSLTASQIEAVIKNTAKDLGTPGYDERYGYGRVNAMQALTAAKTLDTTPPVSYIVSPASGAVIKDVIKIQARALSTREIKHVDFYVNNSYIGTSKQAPYYIAWDSFYTANGPATISAYAYDSNGNKSTPNPVNVLLDNVVNNIAPNVTINSPTQNQQIAPDQTTLTINATATDDLAIKKWEVWADDMIICISNPKFTGIGTTKATIRCNWNVSTINSGNHSIGVVVYDNARNNGSKWLTVIK